MSAAPQPTEAQRAAIGAEGDVLVVAAAGAGKTRTLVERCLDRVLRPEDPVSLDEILMVTFTEAAAAEMRKRIRAELERRLAAAPEDTRLAEQLALLDNAAITTLHGFCLRLVREHFYELNLDPQIAVFDEAQSLLLAHETLDRLLARSYAGATDADEAVRELIFTHGGGRDEGIRTLILKLHRYAQTLADPAGWRRAQRSAFDNADHSAWEQWLHSGLQEWRLDWLDRLQPLVTTNPNAAQCVTALRELPQNFSRQQAGQILDRILATDNEWPERQKTKLRPALEKLFDEAKFLQSITARPGNAADPLAEDFAWVRPHMRALVQLAEDFAGDFAAAKREAGGVDFSDLEQFALDLLWDRGTGQPTAVAAHWRQRLRLVFVDEYQDINAAQDHLIAALGGEGVQANRFLVGDMKQSIYRFRLADPRIIAGRERDWRAGPSRARVVALSENFRSHETILQFINPVFTALLREEIGGVGYPPEARLRFGAPDTRTELSAGTDPQPRVEIHLRLNGAAEPETGGDDSPATNTEADAGDTEMEARLLAARLKELKEAQFKVWHGAGRGWKPVDWRDMVVLLRSPRGRAGSFAREFARAGVPLEVARGGFYETTEVTDLLSLLQLLDNPLQDVPALAVLHSPLAGLTADELAVVRLARRRGRFWLALLAFQREAPAMKSRLADPAIHAAVDSAGPKVGAFLAAFSRWRQQARQGALSHCLESVLDESGYEDWLLAQPRGAQRKANVERLLNLTRQFDPYQRQGLFRFLKFIEAQLELEASPEPAPEPDTNAVRLMSIHQSKGQEFPVVAVANLGQRFNFEDLQAGIILDEQYGLCPQVQPPGTGQRFESLPYWLAAKRQRREAMGEELRLLYVALTRACDRLILTGTSSRRRATERWSGPADGQPTTHEIIEASSPLGWLGPLLPRLTRTTGWLRQERGSNGPVEWRVWSDADLAGSASQPEAGTATPVSAEMLRELGTRLTWAYPWPDATIEPAKSSVSAIRRRADAELADEAQTLFPSARSRRRSAPGKLSSADIGSAHHRLIEYAHWENLNHEAGLRAEVARLQEAGVLSVDEAGALDLKALATFWNSEVGRLVLAQDRRHLHRELPFTARFTASELSALNPALRPNLDAGEFIVVQGFADLAVILPREIWLLDFKTDHFAPSELDAKVAEHALQLRLYAAALHRIYQRPVTRVWLHFLALAETRSVANGV